jgi:DNA polymerase-3 subunit alpha
MQVCAERLRVRLDDAAALSRIHARLERANGRADVSRDAVIDLFVPIAGGGEVELRLPGRHSADSALQAALKGVDGVASVEVA